MCFVEISQRYLKIVLGATEFKPDMFFTKLGLHNTFKNMFFS